MRNKQNYVSFELPSYRGNELLASQMVKASVMNLTLAANICGDVQTAVEETVRNVIDHAYRDEIGKILVRVSTTEDGKLQVVVRDFGSGIENIEEACKPLFAGEGLIYKDNGFNIIEKFSDEVKVESTPEKGTTVTMRFNLN